MSRKRVAATSIGLFSCGVLALSAVWATAEATAEPPEVPGATTILSPTDAELEAQGARIGIVTIRTRPIFDPDAPGENKSAFRLADRLHADTRPSVIEAQLLFKPGDLYSRRVLDETERNLRKFRFIREPEIAIVGYQDGIVNLEVAAHEVWTTNPGVSFGRAGGTNAFGVQLEELNLLGRGKQVSLGYDNDVDRSSYAVEWHDPNVLGSRWRDTIGFTDSSDGNSQLFVLERPFYSLNTRWSAGLSFDHDDSIESVYRLGHQIGEYRRNAQIIDVGYGWSKGLQDGWTRRWHAGLRHDDAQFSESPDEPGSVVPPGDRSLSYPYLRWEGVQDDFEKARNLDQISRTEDLHFGTKYAIEAGWSATAFDADRIAAVLSSKASRGIRLGDGQSMFVAGGLAGRVEEGSAKDTLLSASLRYYWQTSLRTTFFTSLSVEQGWELDADHELYLGGDNGLRGYPLRYQTGSGRALLTIEQRFYTDRTLWRLAKIGAAVFADVGKTWGESAFGPTGGLGVLKDIGFGLRLGHMRTGLANVLHLDIAFPLDGERSIDQVQFLVQTKESF